MTVRIAGASLTFKPFDEMPASLPEAWRDLDRSVWRWVRAHGGDALLAETAGWASHADGRGHSALPLDGAYETRPTPWTDREIAGLSASGLVWSVGRQTAGAAAMAPFVLDEHHFYLARNFKAERAVASALRRRRSEAAPARQPVSDDELRALFNGSWKETESRQREAVRSAPGKRMMVLTGGPGTGKTTTVLRMLLAVSREHEATRGQLPQIRIAAPTGKAAQRLSESLRQGAMQFSASTVDAGWRHFLANVLGAEAGTVHRLLGSRGRHGGYEFHAGEPLPADIVVVDEASMLDLGLLRALLSALSDDAVLVLVGDADQLTSVGTGSVMSDIVEAMEADPRGDLVRLSHCFRADTSLVPINEAIRTGDEDGFQGAWQAAEAGGVAQAFVVQGIHELKARVDAWTRRLRSCFRELGMATPVEAGDHGGLGARLYGLRRQQLLCALREGLFGAAAIAAEMARQLRGWSDADAWSDKDWWPGRSIIVTRNDHAARLYNGDVGVCLPVVLAGGGTRLQVVFEAVQDASQADKGPRLFDPNTLPPHEDAFALTIHKSQGSEYEHVAVLLPPEPESQLLTRQTLYTALSRAKHSVELWSTPRSTTKALQTKMLRHGRLGQRITAPVSVD